MLATSPRRTPASSPVLNDSTALFLRRSHSKTRGDVSDTGSGRTKSASPIVKPRSAHVYANPSTSSSNNLVNVSTSTTRHQSRPQSQNSSQCNVSTQSSPLQSFQPPSTRLTTTDRSTQTSPSRLEFDTKIAPQPGSDLNSTAPKRPQMVDAQTQYSPTPQSRIAPTPATQIASLRLHESNSSSSLSSSISSSPHIRRRPFDPVADAAMSSALKGTSSTPSTSSIVTATTSTPSQQGQTQPTQSQLRRVPSSSATKRNHSVSDETTQPSNTAQREDATPSTTQQPTTQPSTSTSSKKMRPLDTPVRRLPLDYSLCPPRDLVLLISSMLLDLIRYNDAIPLASNHLTRFHSRAPPGISVVDYLQRLTTHATLLPPILLSMVFYIDKLCALYPAFTISSLTVHRFLITAATVASKGLSDSFWTNKTYARVGGVSVRELALLEMELLTRVQWRIVPQPEVLSDYYRSLVGRTEGYELEEEEQKSGNGGSQDGSADSTLQQNGQATPAAVDAG